MILRLRPTHFEELEMAFKLPFSLKRYSPSQGIILGLLLFLLGMITGAALLRLYQFFK
jgi:hypothetical protein